MVERVFSRLKDEFGANSIRVRGANLPSTNFSA